MLHEFIEFQLCKGAWKLDRWATLNYPLWVKNHIKVKAASSGMKSMKKAKSEHPNVTPNLDVLDDENLIYMENESNKAPLGNFNPVPKHQHNAIAGSIQTKPILVSTFMFNH